MTLPKFALRYKDFSQADLQLFVKARNGRRMRKNASKKSLIKELVALDEAATFRFVDLPPEMRNLVYELLLTHNRFAGRKAYPAILRTSKSMYQESKSILDADKVISIDATYRCFPRLHGGYVDLKGDVKFQDMLSTLQRHFERDLGSKLKLLPSIGSLKIKLRLFSIGPPRPQDMSFPKIKYFIDMLFRPCRGLKRFEIEWRIQDGVFDLDALASLVAHIRTQCVARGIELQFKSLPQNVEESNS
ncbi:hypothetical protein CKM354_001131500 [Cercospora kikuchii]|uniref:F-box domain-containing protein n=1 Tax=Cercospora kikuchii TaxID=84275 RepID=A0A9P3CVB6_9PEZI|nr:uncharacterized protein CKM354_001131500 [Cercospora kikuchii]GIZ48247.1 hypothetical protein CKM354_001131500 [Cercospora kikuchii]